MRLASSGAIQNRHECVSHSRMRVGTASTGWDRTWRAAELTQRPAEAQPARAAVLAALAGGLATLLGTSLGTELRPTWAQVAAAVAVGVLTLGVVVVALQGTTTRAHLVVLTAALLSAGAAAIHFAVIQSHFEEWWGFGAFFVASGVAQPGHCSGWACSATLRSSRSGS